MGVLPISIDEWAERMKLRMMIVGIIGFLISGCSTYTEARYLVFGKTTQAEVTNVDDNARGGRRSTWSIKYTFEEDDGTVRNEEDYGSGAISMQGTGTFIDVEYIPSALESSRISGHTRRWSTIPFLICAVLVSIASVKFMKEYREHERRSR